MNVYFDAEFTGLVPNTTLISIGMIAETGEKYYAEFTDYKKELVTPWILENVIGHLFLEEKTYNYATYKHIKQTDGGTKVGGVYARGETEFIRSSLSCWLKRLADSSEERIQLIGDVAYYDMYLLVNQVFEGVNGLPKYVNPVCYDICQDLCARANKSVESVTIPNSGRYTTTWYADLDYMKDAFDIFREKVCLKFQDGKLPEGHKHVALYDAEVIRLIYEGMRKG